MLEMSEPKRRRWRSKEC